MSFLDSLKNILNKPAEAPAANTEVKVEVAVPVVDDVKPVDSLPPPDKVEVKGSVVIEVPTDLAPVDKVEPKKGGLEELLAKMVNGLKDFAKKFKQMVPNAPSGKYKIPHDIEAGPPKESVDAAPVVKLKPRNKKPNQLDVPTQINPIPGEEHFRQSLIHEDFSKKDE